MVIEGTKLDLIVAAGELFTEHGPDGASIRAIVEKAGTSIAAVNYHFGSKENLYAEVLRYAAGQTQGIQVEVVLKEDERLKSPGGVARILLEIVREQFHCLFSPDRPAWIGRLLARSVMEPSPALDEVERLFFKPGNEALKTVFLHAKPGMSDEEAQFWAWSLFGQIAFYGFAQVPLLMLIEKSEYDRAFLDKAVDHVARVMIAALGLPWPEGNREC